MRRLRQLFSGKRVCRPLAYADGEIAARYQSFKCLLDHNRSALERIARLEQFYFGSKPFSLASVRTEYVALVEALYGIVHALEALCGEALPALTATVEHIDDAIEAQFNPQQCPLKDKRLVMPFSDVLPEMKPLVGSKAANLAVIGNTLGLQVPEGFAITAHACERFLEHNGLSALIQGALDEVVPEATEDIERCSGKLQQLILDAALPQDLADEIMAAFEHVEAAVGPGLRVAMRSSSVGEDTEQTFAGQYETVLNVTRADLFAAYKRVLASKYAPQAISYRMQHGLDDRETPMCVAAVTMVDALASGVVYSRDPSQADMPLLKVNSLWGLGEQLVDGSASPDVFLVDRDNGEIRERAITRKQWRLLSRQGGGTELGEIPADEQAQPSISDTAVKTLADYCLLLEEFFGGPQDVEWACSASGALYLLQSRPLYLPEVTTEEKTRRDYPGHAILLDQGVMASPGAATGRVHVALTEEDLKSVPKDAILVVRTASPKCAGVAPMIKGLIADVGSATSHMASVAREFGLPAIFDAKAATRKLKTGDVVTMAASSVTVYQGIVEDLLRVMQPARKFILDSPVHQRMRAILDLITPLNLIDPHAQTFSPEGCRTFHDIIRYAHEQAVRSMFGISEGSMDASAAIKLKTSLPLSLYLIDLGGGLQQGLTSCDDITSDKLECRPLTALWTGLTHPGVSWEGTMNTGTNKLASSLAAVATADFGEQPGGDSYALISADYLNFSAKFAYHFATVDALCSDNSAQNYISLQFSGGAGGYYGRSLRVQLMANILERLEFQVTLNGDLLEAVFPRHDAPSSADRLDQLGRLLATSKLLDMTLSNQDEIASYCEAFFAGNYDFLAQGKGGALPSLYVQGGHWTRIVEGDHAYCVQDGAPYGKKISARITGTLAKVMGMSYYEFLDNIEANYYFPLAIAKNCALSEGTIGVRIKPVSGKLDQAGGIAFGIKDRDSYFVLRLNALEDNIMLFEFRNGRRYSKAAVARPVDAGVWHHLQVGIHGTQVEGFLNGEAIIRHDTGTPLAGYIGLWTKSDSTTWFDELEIEDGGIKKRVAF